MHGCSACSIAVLRIMHAVWHGQNPPLKCRINMHARLSCWAIFLSVMICNQMLIRPLEFMWIVHVKPLACPAARAILRR